MKVSTENVNNFGYEKITIVVDNMPLKENTLTFYFVVFRDEQVVTSLLLSINCILKSIDTNKK